MAEYWRRLVALVRAWRRARGGWLDRPVNGLVVGEDLFARMRAVVNAK